MLNYSCPGPQGKQQLLKKREELVSRLRKIQADIACGLSPDASERAIELENAEVLDEIARVTAEELQALEAAIERIK